MSSTNRAKGGYVRHEDDFYATPSWCTRALLRHLQKIGLLSPALAPIRSVLDPFSGRGAILDVCSDGDFGLSTYGFEINDERAKQCSRDHHCEQVDAFGMHWGGQNLILTNPPFFAALEGIEKALASIQGVRTYAATAAFLLRLNFLGSKKRASLHTRAPAEVLIMSRRPSFRDDGKTDSIEYAWFLWGRGASPGTWSILQTEEG